MREVGKLRPYPRNPRKHPRRQIDELKRNIEGIGFTNPLLIDPEGGIIAGHGRLIAAKELEMRRVPCIVLGGLTDSEKRAVIIADNKISADGVWDDEVLKAELAHLSDLSFDMDLTGFDFKSIGDLDPKLTPVDSEVTDEMVTEGMAGWMENHTGIPQDNNILRTVMIEDVVFPSSNPLGMPDLMPDKLGDFLPEVPWNRREPEETPPEKCLFTWGEHRRSICKPDHTRGSTLCFFEEDAAFNGIWDARAATVGRMLEYEWGQIVSPDFTFYRNAPLVVAYYTHFKSLYMSRFFQESGFKVVPKLELIDPRDKRTGGGWQYLGIPVGAPVVAVQVNTVYGRTASKDSYEQRGMFYNMMEGALSILKFGACIIYGGKEHEDHMRENLPKGPEYRIIPGISSLHRAKNKKSGNWG
ncbi:MAG: DUF4417 domain-containing protein [Gammaproteobacteria bacterium]|nr:DUF4417 domain-containing protein [Gammaproteobacteria bacterium]